MFDVGFMELVLISVIGLLVLGPQRLPKVAAQIGKWVGRARRTATQLRRQLEREIELEDLERLRAARPAPPPAASSTPSPDVAVPGTPDVGATTDVGMSSASTATPDGVSDGGAPSEKTPQA